MTEPRDRPTFPFTRAAGTGAVIFALMGAPTMAREADADAAPYAVAVRHLDPHPNSPVAAQRTLDRLGDAALEACGGSGFSLREVKLAIRSSPCWRAAMAGVVDRIGDPLLAQAYTNLARRNG